MVLAVGGSFPSAISSHSLSHSFIDLLVRSFVTYLLTSYQLSILYIDPHIDLHNRRRFVIYSPTTKSRSRK